MHQFGSGSGLHLFLFQIKWDGSSRKEVVSLKFLSVKYVGVQYLLFFTANNFWVYRWDWISEGLWPLMSFSRCSCRLVIILPFLFSSENVFLEQVDGFYHQVSRGGWRIQESGICTCRSYEAQRHDCEKICFWYFTVKVKMLCEK